MSEELKPVKCGCGGEAKVISYLSREYCKMAYYVRCENCGTETDDLHSEAEAIEAWNRAMGERTAKVKEGWGLAMCCACKKRVFPCDDYCSHCGSRLDWSGNE